MAAVYGIKYPGGVGTTAPDSMRAVVLTAGAAAQNTLAAVR